MGYSYTRARRVFERQLKRFGKQAASECKIVRDGVYRPCVGARLEYKPRERGLYTDAEARILISAKSIDDNGILPPEFEKDQILYAGTLYNIIQPILGPRQADPTIIYYDCQVVAVQNVTLITIDPLTMTIGMDMASAGIQRVIEFTSALDFGFDVAAEEIERSRFVAALLELGFDVELPELELTTYLSASMELGFEMSPPPFYERIEEVSATLPLGFDMAVSAITREFYLSASLPLGFEVGADATSEVNDILLSASMQLGFEIEAFATSEEEPDTGFMGISQTTVGFNSYNQDYELLTDPATQLPSTASEMRWSPNGRYLACAHFSSPYLTIYDYNTGVPVKLANPAVLPTNTLRCITWHPSGEFVVCGGDDTSLVEVYFVNGMTITRAASRPTNPGNAVSSVRFVPINGGAASLFYLMVAYGTTQPVKYLCNYTVGSFVITSWGASEAQTACAGTVNFIEMNFAGTKMVACHTTTPFITTYTITGGGTFVKDSNVSSPPNSSSNAFRARFSPNDARLAVLHSGGDELTVYNTSDYSKRSSSFTQPDNPTDLAWSDDSSQLFVTQSSSPYLIRYRAEGMIVQSALADHPATATWSIDTFEMPGIALADTGDAVIALSDTTPQTGQVITVDITTPDPEGASSVTYSLRDQGGGTTLVGPQASNSFTITQAMLGLTLRGRMNYTDGAGVSEQVETATSTAVAQGTQLSSISGELGIGTGTTGGSTTTGTFSVAAGSVVLVLGCVVGAGAASISSVTNNKGLTVVPVDAHSVTFSQTISKNMVMYFAAIYCPTAQTGMTVTLNHGGNQNTTVSAVELFGSYISQWGVTGNLGSGTSQLFRRSITRSLNAAAPGQSFQVSNSPGSQSTSSRWIGGFGTMGVGQGSPANNENIGNLDIGGSVMSSIRDNSQTNQQCHWASRAPNNTSPETIAAATSGGDNQIREQIGLFVEVTGYPP